MAVSALDAAGIDCHLVDQNMVGIDWAVSQAVGGVKVFVRDDDLDRAREILGSHVADQQTLPSVEARAEEPLSVCPVCGSSDFRWIPRFRLFLLTAAVFIGIGVAVGQSLLAATALLAVAMGALLMPSARCASCMHRWSPLRSRVEAPLPDAVDTVEKPCPRCGSLDVYQIDNRRLKAIPLLINSSIFFVLPIWLLSSKRRCESCGSKLP